MAKESGKAPAEEDRARLKALFERNYRKVVYYFLRVGVGDELARDLAQETFLRAHKGFDSFRGESSEETWLSEIARNIYRNWVRDRHALKNQATEISLDAADYGDDETSSPLEIADPDPLPIDVLLTSERDQKLRTAVAMLSAQRRLGVELRLRGLQYNEIASIMGLSIETVKSHLYQAREALRQSLGGLE